MQACDLVDSQKILIFYFEFTKKNYFLSFHSQIFRSKKVSSEPIFWMTPVKKLYNVL